MKRATDNNNTIPQAAQEQIPWRLSHWDGKPFMKIGNWFGEPSKELQQSFIDGFLNAYPSRKSFEREVMCKPFEKEQVVKRNDMGFPDFTSKEVIDHMEFLRTGIHPRLKKNKF